MCGVVVEGDSVEWEVLELILHGRKFFSFSGFFSRKLTEAGILRKLPRLICIYHGGCLRSIAIVNRIYRIG